MVDSTWHRSRIVPVASAGLAIAVVVAWLTFSAADDGPAEPAPPSGSGVVTISDAGPAAPLAPLVRSIDRANFMGARACLDCHRSEFVSWLGTQHYSNTKKNRFEGTENSIDTRYRQEVGNVDLCYTCHSASPEERFGRTLVETGTSCESCHGAAGGPGGWYNGHSVYGPNVTRLENETSEHYASRIDFCNNAGMIRPSRMYEVAKNCYRCHIIGDPALVGASVRHPVSFENFALLPYLLGEVRHNFHLNQRHNAETPTLDTLRRGLSRQQRNRLYLVIGQLAKMEVALNYLANLPTDEAFQENYAGDLAGLVEDAAGEIEDFRDVLLDPDAESVPPLSEEDVAPLQGAIEAFEAFDNQDVLTRASAAESARTISSLAAQFEAAHDGSRLAALDVFLEELPEPVGRVLQP